MRRRSTSIAAVSFLLFWLAACSTADRKHRSTKNDSTFSRDTSVKALDGEETQGLASWYGRRFHRRRTASGERFNMYDYTAAHRTLPFGSRIRIRNLRSGKTTVVRINDRGPHSRNRLIDVSFAAGRALGILSTGLAQVKLEAM